MHDETMANKIDVEAEAERIDKRAREIASHVVRLVKSGDGLGVAPLCTARFQDIGGEFRGEFNTDPTFYELMVSEMRLALTAAIASAITCEREIVRDEAIRETVEMACKAACYHCAGEVPVVLCHTDWNHRWKGDGVVRYNPCAAQVIRQAFAEPGKEQEPCDIGKEKGAPLIHGVNCLKVQHTRPHMHEPDDDSPYPVDDVWYCGRCHFAITPPAVPALTLRQFVDAAVRLADAHMEYPASGHPDDMADTETILRLAPQFREQAP